MSRKHSYAEVANDYELWGEYVDPDATMKEEEFDNLSEEEKVAMQVEMFGKEEGDNDE